MNNVPIHFTVMINIGLALIPFVLAFVLFRWSKKRNMLWWLGTMVFVLFLPNSAYTLTDIIHYIAAIQSPDISILQLIFLYTPFYILYMLFCFECYVLSVQWSFQYIKEQHWQMLSKLYLPVILFLTAIGVYLGRFQRLESYDIIRNPLIVFKDLYVDLTHWHSLVIIIALFLGFATSYRLFTYLNHIVLLKVNSNKSMAS